MSGYRKFQIGSKAICTLPKKGCNYCPSGKKLSLKVIKNQDYKTHLFTVFLFKLSTVEL